jgi:hypothetical protein
MNGNSIYLNPIDHYEITKIMISLQPKKISGYDKLSSRYLKQISLAIINTITMIVNRSLSEGIVKWKLQKLFTPSSLKDKGQFNNYRPISLLPFVSKVLEHVVHKTVYTFLIHHNSQYSFLSWHSTINVITEFATDALKSFDEHENIVSVFLDFSNAFDTIDHSVENYTTEIRDLALEWFRSHQSDRKQYVSVYRFINEVHHMWCHTGFSSRSIVYCVHKWYSSTHIIVSKYSNIVSWFKWLPQFNVWLV